MGDSQGSAAVLRDAGEAGLIKHLSEPTGAWRTTLSPDVSTDFSRERALMPAHQRDKRTALTRVVGDGDRVWRGMCGNSVPPTQFP